VSNDELTPEEAELLAEFQHLLADPALWAEPDEALEARVMAAIGAEAAAAAPTASRSNVYRAAPSRRRRWLASAGAAVVGAAAAVAVMLVVTRDEATPVDATAVMTGTDLAPGLNGTAEVTAGSSGVRIAIEVPGLPRRDGGEFYQVWLKSCDGTQLVPAGSFHDLERAVAWAGVSTDDFPLITVTREEVAPPKDAAQGSSGEVVVAGAVGECPS